MAELRERVVVTGGSAGLGLSIVVALAQTPLVAGPKLGCKRARLSMVSSRRVADSLDVVSIGIKYKRTVIVRVIVRTHTRGAVILAARRERRVIEPIHRCPIFRRYRNVQRLLQHSFAPNPEIRFATAAETSGWHSSCLRGRLHD